MKKPRPTLRKPPPAADAFVALDTAPGATPVVTPDVQRQTSDARRPEVEAPRVRWRRTVRTKADGTRTKRLTIYLPEELAHRLAVQADLEERSMSDLIAAALEATLG